MFVEICRVDDKDSVYYLDMNMSAGHDIKRGKLHPNNPTEYYYIDILNEGNAWKSPTANYESIPDGTYTFLRDEKGNTKVVLS
jgi:hypothetical protein